MKKLLTYILTMTLCLSLFSGCIPIEKLNSNAVPANAIKLKLMIGNDKDWVFENVKSIIKSNNITVNGKPIYISYDKAGTGEAMDKILADGSDYVGWMPASSTHVQWANDLWFKKGHTKPIVDTNYTTVFLTPTVIAMQESLAKLMGYPEKKIGWKDIFELSTATNGWGMYNKSVLNPVRFAHTHPAKSNSGLNALIAEEYAFSGKQKGLTLQDVTSNSEKIKKVEETIVHYGESTSLLQKKIMEKGPKFVQYAVLYEYMVAGMNKMNTTGKEKVVAIYPSEGTIWGDVCFTNVYTTNVTNDQKLALDQVKKILLSPQVQRMGMDQYFFRPASPDISLSNAISLENGVNPNEPQTTLELPKIEVVNAILDDWLKNMKKRANVVFVMDTSGSMRGEPFENTKEALKNLFNKQLQQKNYTSIDDQDTISLLPFNTQTAEPFSVIGKDIDQMNMVMDNISPSGTTCFYDSVFKAIQLSNKIKEQQKDKKINIIVALTDGADTSSQMTYSQLIEYIEKQEGTLPVIITIGYGKVEKSILEEIADKTGGKYYEGDPQKIKKVFEEIKTFF